MKKYLKTTNLRPSIKQNDALWNKAVKLRARMKSELKCIEGSYIASHHIIGKPTHALRYNLDNGICITTGQHKWVAHHTGRAGDFKEKALKIRGVTEDQLKLTSRNKVDLWGVQMYLKSKIEEYNNKG